MKREMSVQGADSNARSLTYHRGVPHADVELVPALAAALVEAHAPHGRHNAERHREMV